MNRRKDGLWRPKWKDRRTGEVRQSSVWWCTYSVGGKRYRESTGCDRYTDAKCYRAQRLIDVGLKRPAPRDVERVRFEDLAEQVRAHYKKNRLRSERKMKIAVRHLEDVFGGWRAIDINGPAIAQYQAQRLEDGMAPATVNWETTLLRQGFRICKRLGLLTDVPVFEMLKLDNVRKGFVTDPQLQAVLEKLPAVHHGWVEALYVTAWRVGEMLSREWRHVQDGWLILEPGETKTKEARRFPITPRLQAILNRQWERKERIERKRDIVVRHIFTYDNGRPIRQPRKSWNKAVDEAGYPGLLVHDLRRSGIMAMMRAGISQIAAMKFSGHRSDSVFRRYAIHSQDMLREAGEKLQALHDRESKEPERKVVDLR